MATSAKTQRPVSRSKKPPTSNRAKAGNAAAAAHLTTLAERAATTGRAVLIHGPTGAGKTVLAIHKAPRPILVLDADNGLDSVIGTTDMEDVHIWRPSEGDSYTYEDLDGFRNYVKSGDWVADYKVIVPDNLTSIQKPILRYAIDELINARASKKDEDEGVIDRDVPSRQAWGKIYRVYDRWIQDVRDAKRRGAHVIFTAGTSEWMDDTEGYSRLMPDIEGKERNQVATHMDAVGWMEQTDEGRVLHLGPSGAFITKVRLPIGRHGSVPDELQNPDFNDLMKAVEVITQEEPTPKTSTKTKATTKKKVVRRSTK